MHLKKLFISNALHFAWKTSDGGLVHTKDAVLQCLANSKTNQSKVKHPIMTFDTSCDLFLDLLLALFLPLLLL